jgi:fermentation-respiration switch protein FrsA (DUF1100 family)
VFSLLFPRAARRLSERLPAARRGPRPSLGKLVRGAIIGVVVAYLGVLGALYVFQRNLLYPRDASRADIATLRVPGAEEIAVTTSDGERLVAWHLPPGEGRPVLVYFHGNAGNLAREPRLLRFRAFAREGIGVLAVHYRGYGGSTGTPTEAGLHLDARAAYAEAERLYGQGRLVAYGESLGTGVATRLAVENPVRALVLDAPYTSTAGVAERIYRLIPVRQLMHDQFRSDEIIGRLRAPLLVLHGTDDRVIPVEHGEELYRLAPEPKRLVLFEGGRHEDLAQRGATAIVTRFLDEALRGELRGAETVRIRPGR